MTITAQDIGVLKKEFSTIFATKEDLSNAVADLKGHMTQNFVSQRDREDMVHEILSAVSDAFRSVPNNIQFQDHEYRLQNLERKIK